MTTLDDLFRTPVDPLPDPRLRTWKRRLEQPGVKVALELYRPAALGLSPTEMNLHFTENNEPGATESMLWDDDLNTGLIRLGVRAIDGGHEAERFALGLRGALRKAEREFGNGYLNGVLIEFLEDSDLTGYPEVADVLPHIFAAGPNGQGKESGYLLCREMIADAIRGRAHELTEQLGYGDQEARSILVRAIARYLDERFSVSSRRRLGLI